MATTIEAPAATSAPTRLPRTPALVAGFGLLLMAIVAGLANFVAIEPLITAGDAPATAAAITASEGTFRWGIAGLLVVGILDVVVAWALFAVFRATAPVTSAVAGLARVVYAAVHVVAVLQLPGALSAGSAAEVLASAERFQTIWTTGLGLFGLHLLVVGWLAWQAGTRGSRVVGALVTINGAAYTTDAIGPLLFADYGLELALYTFVGELVLMAWLLVVGFRRPAAA